MRYLVLLCSISLFALSCSKQHPKHTDVAGTWQLKEMLADPGDGSGVFYPVQSNKKLTFNSDGVVTSNGSICTMSIETDVGSKGTYSEDDMTISSQDCTGLKLKYEFDGNTLIVIYPCIEPCKAKYVRVR